MLRVFTVLSVFVLVATTVFAQAVNPARQYEQQRNSQPPADGVWYVYDREGNLSKEEHYKTYRLDGDIKTFYPNGAIKAHTPYVDGQRHGLEKVYYEQGGLMEENNYINNNIEGESRHYYKEGPLEKTANYVRSQLDGTTKIYYPNGSLKQVWNYKQGIINGSLLNYSDDGHVVSEDIYQNGALVAHKDYTKDDSSFISASPRPAGKMAEGSNTQQPKGAPAMPSKLEKK